jgi:hypothetical protein
VYPNTAYVLPRLQPSFETRTVIEAEELGIRLEDDLRRFDIKLDRKPIRPALGH